MIAASRSNRQSQKARLIFVWVQQVRIDKPLNPFKIIKLSRRELELPGKIFSIDPGLVLADSWVSWRWVIWQQFGMLTLFESALLFCFIELDGLYVVCKPGGGRVVNLEPFFAQAFKLLYLLVWRHRHL